MYFLFDIIEFLLQAKYNNNFSFLYASFLV